MIEDNWYRTCQECGHVQRTRHPNTYTKSKDPEAWRDVQCKKCGSAALDYGKVRS